MTKTQTDNICARMSADERREQILLVAMKLFGKKGFEGTTTKNIASSAGVSEATVFKYFKSKEDLYAAILDYKACSIAQNDPFKTANKFIEEKDDFNVFYTLALNALKKHKGDKNFIRLMMYSALEGHDLSKSFVENFVIQMYDHIGKYIKSRQQEGVFREVNPRIVMRAFTGMFIHQSLNNILLDKEQRILKISDEEAAREFAAILLDGIKLK